MSLCCVLGDWNIAEASPQPGPQGTSRFDCCGEFNRGAGVNSETEGYELSWKDITERRKTQERIGGSTYKLNIGGGGGKSRSNLNRLNDAAPPRVAPPYMQPCSMRENQRSMLGLTPRNGRAGSLMRTLMFMRLTSSMKSSGSSRRTMLTHTPCLERVGATMSMPISMPATLYACAGSKARPRSTRTPMRDSEPKADLTSMRLPMPCRQRRWDGRKKRHTPERRRPPRRLLQSQMGCSGEWCGNLRAEVTRVIDFRKMGRFL